MLKINFETSPGMRFEIDATTIEDAFENIANIKSIFAHRDCGICGEKDTRMAVRRVDEYTYYELACQNPKCRAKFNFSHTKQGLVMFPKRYVKLDPEGNPDKDGKNDYSTDGWFRYGRQDQQYSQQDTNDTIQIHTVERCWTRMKELGFSAANPEEIKSFISSILPGRSGLKGMDQTECDKIWSALNDGRTRDQLINTYSTAEEKLIDMDSDDNPFSDD